MPISNAQIFNARRRTASEDMTRLRAKFVVMQELCPKHQKEMAVLLKALARMQKRLVKIAQD